MDLDADMREGLILLLIDDWGRRAFFLRRICEFVMLRGYLEDASVKVSA